MHSEGDSTFADRRDVLKELRRQYAYVSCVETRRMRTMLAAILQQLKVSRAPVRAPVHVLTAQEIRRLVDT